MPTVTASREIDAPAALVWGIVTDLETAQDELSQVTRIERLDDGGDFDVGTRWRESRRVAGREMTEEVTVTAVEPGESYVAKTESPGIRTTSTVAVRPIGEQRSQLAMSFETEPVGFIARVVETVAGRLLAKPLRRAMEQDMTDVAAAAKRRAQAGG